MNFTAVRTQMNSVTRLDEYSARLQNTAEPEVIDVLFTLTFWKMITGSKTMYPTKEELAAHYLMKGGAVYVDTVLPVILARELAGYAAFEGRVILAPTKAGKCSLLHNMITIIEQSADREKWSVTLSGFHEMLEDLENA